MGRIKRISVRKVQYLSFRLAQEHMSFNEPIPNFSTRFPNILESCLATPFQTFSGKYLYPNLISKASILFYLMIKNHPFQNGNKRIAMTTLFVFLYENKKWLKVDAMDLYNFAVWVTQSLSKLKDATVKGIEKFLKEYMVDLEE